jgi:hypothetical protein
MEQQDYLESTAFMIAAFCHDIKHIGRNNNFCVASEHPLAFIYNNSAVLENFHSSTCLELLESNAVLKQLPLKERALVRSHIIENILATDMTEHFETISKFRVRREAQDFSTVNEADRRFVARLCLKSGDLGHACLPWNLHVEWASRVTMEFYAQGDEEKSLGLPISALCDRKDVANLAKSQKGFLEFVVSPLYRVLEESQPAWDEDAIQAESPRAKNRRVSNVNQGLKIDQCAIFWLQRNALEWENNTKAVKETQRLLDPMFEVEEEPSDDDLGGGLGDDEPSGNYMSDSSAKNPDRLDSRDHFEGSEDETKAPSSLNSRKASSNLGDSRRGSGGDGQDAELSPIISRHPSLIPSELSG